MTANQAMFPLSTMCKSFGVSRAGYYAWLGREPSARSLTDAELTVRIKAIHKASRETYGVPRIHAELIDEGIHVGRKRVERLMKAAGIVGVSRRKAARTTFRGERVRPACDLVDRNFYADEPDRLWVADITYVPTWAGFLYLAVVLDAFSRRIVGWAMGHNLKAQLVLDAMNMAIAQRRPQDVIHHSDQGSQYTSIAFGLRCKEAGVRPSMGSVGDTGACPRAGRARPGGQCDVRELLRDARMRVARQAQVPDQGRGQNGNLPVHRGLVQSGTAAFRPWLPAAHQLRKQRP
jgi:putative transposase